MLRGVLVGLVLLGASSTASAGPCAIDPLIPGPLVNAPIVEGGGVVIALIHGGFAATPPKEIRADQAGWRFKDVNTLKQPALRVIAPGLAVYALPAGGSPTLTLVDDAGTSVAEVTRALAAKDPLPAPKLKKVTTTQTVSTGPRSFSYTQTHADLVEAPPADAVALVIYDASDDKKPVALTWGTFQPGEKRGLVYFSGARCRPGIPGQQGPAKRARVKGAWLDSSGRLSAYSKTVVVSS